jgi:hypothetical protein
MSESLFNVPVISLRVGQPIAIAIEPIINPHNLKIIGWWCKSPSSSGIQIADKLVKTKRQKVGKVHDFSYNDGMFVQKLYVARSLVKIFSAEDTAIIDRTQIIEITDTYILVRDAEVKAGDEELAGAAVPA